MRRELLMATNRLCHEFFKPLHELAAAEFPFQMVLLFSAELAFDWDCMHLTKTLFPRKVLNIDA